MSSILLAQLIKRAFQAAGFVLGRVKHFANDKRRSTAAKGFDALSLACLRAQLFFFHWLQRELFTRARRYSGYSFDLQRAGLKLVVSIFFQTTNVVCQLSLLPYFHRSIFQMNDPHL